MTDFDVRLLSEDEQNTILLEAQRRFTSRWDFASLEDLLTSKEGFALTTATPLQRACCRIIEGVPLGDLAYEPTVQKALDYYGAWSVNAAPAEVIIVAGIRTAKSLIAAAVAVWASQKCSVDHLLPGEIPRYSIVSLELDNAKVVLAHLIGALSMPKLKHLELSRQDEAHWRKLIDDTGSNTVGSLFLWTPAGRPVEVRVVAGKRAGGSGVSRWSIGVALDEAPRMVGASEGVINYDDTKRAVRGRLLPGAQILSIGSPWQPQGPVYDAVQNDWGSPTESRVVIKAPGPDMNPYWWTEERVATLRDSKNPDDLMVYQTDVLAEFADAEESLFPQSVLEHCSRDTADHIPYEEGHDYRAAMDPATRGNAWTLLIGDRVGNKKRIVFHKQWQGSPIEPLNPRLVIQEIRYHLSEYNLDWAYTDQWSGDAIREIGLSLGVNFVISTWTAANRVEMFQSLSKCASIKGMWEIPKDPMLIKDFRMVKRVPTSGRVSIKLEKTTDGRHCDYAPPAARLFKEWIDEEFDMPPKQGEPGYLDHIEQAMITRELEEHENSQEREWWEGGADEPYDILRGVF